MSKAVQQQQRAVSHASRHPGQFLREVWLELKKVKWPTGQEIWHLTVVVLLTCLAVGFYVAILDFGLSAVFRALHMYA